MVINQLDPTVASEGFAAIGSEARLLVLQTLVRAGPEGMPIGDIQQRLEIPASTLAHHLRSLKAAQLIEQEKQGRQVINRANYPLIEALAAYLLHECCADAGSAT